MGVAVKSRQAAERATEAACQAKRRMESELARLQRLAAELESSKRCHPSCMLHPSLLLILLLTQTGTNQQLELSA